MLVLTRNLNEALLIGADVVVRVLGIEVAPDGIHVRVKLGIQAPRETEILREELITNGVETHANLRSPDKRR